MSKSSKLYGPWFHHFEPPQRVVEWFRDCPTALVRTFLGHDTWRHVAICELESRFEARGYPRPYTQDSLNQLLKED